jgi:hypothetical protein
VSDKSSFRDVSHPSDLLHESSQSFFEAPTVASLLESEGLRDPIAQAFTPGRQYLKLGKAFRKKSDRVQAFEEA